MPDYHNILDTPEKFGRSVDERELLWAGIHQHVVDILGSGGSSVPMGDPNHEDSGLTVVTALGATTADFTYKPNGPRTNFDVPLYYKGPGQIPILSFNGLDEYLETPDATAHTHQDWSGTNGFSFVFWANVITGIPSSERTLYSKWNAGLREYSFLFTGEDKLKCIIHDDTEGAECSRLSDAAVTMGAWKMFGVTYAGIGGADAANYIDLYENEVQIASTPANDPDYVGMRNTTAKPMIGRNGGATNQRWYTGEIAGGPLGPLYSKDLIGISTMKQLYHLGRSAMAL